MTYKPITDIYYCFCRSQCPVGYELVNLDDSVHCPTVEDVFPGDDSSSLFLIKFPPDVSLKLLSDKDLLSQKNALGAKIPVKE